MHEANTPQGPLIASGILTVVVGVATLALGVALGGAAATLAAGPLLLPCGFMGVAMGVIYALRGVAESVGLTAYLGSVWRLPFVAMGLVMFVVLFAEPSVRFEYMGCAALFALGVGVGGLCVSTLRTGIRRR